MNFYRISHCAVGGPKYAWASGYGPLPEMPFVNELPPDFKQQRENFWKTNPQPPGLSVDKTGRQWPDVIGLGLGFPHYCVSEKVIADLNEEGIEIWRKTEMPIATIASKRLKELMAPKYFVIEGERGFDVDFAASGVPLDADGEPLLRQRSPLQTGPLVMRLGSWNGQDLVSLRNAGATMNVVCSERVKILAEEKSWTNITFLSLPTV